MSGNYREPFESDSMNLLSSEISPEISMGRLQELVPGARRALFRNFHIGGCSSCGFRDDETLREVCQRNDVADLNTVVEVLLKAHDDDEKLFIGPERLHQWRQENRPHRLVDIRSREEHEAVCITPSEFFDSTVSAQIMETSENSHPVVLYDHQGRYVLDSVSYFIGHGCSNIFGLKGGIDLWAREIDKSMARYHLE